MKDRSVNPGKNPQTSENSFSNYFKTMALALATFFPNIGCSTSNLSPDRGSQNGKSSELLKESALENNRARAISAVGQFDLQPDPQELLLACRRDLAENGIDRELNLNPETGRIVVKSRSISPDGIILEDYVEVASFRGELVLNKESGKPFIRSVAVDVDGNERETYRPLYRYMASRPDSISQLSRDSLRDFVSRVDFSRDGVISLEELRAAVGDKGITGGTAQQVAAFLANHGSIEHLGDKQPGISPADFDALMAPGSRLLYYINNRLKETDPQVVLPPQSLYGGRGYPTPYDGASLSPQDNLLMAAIISLVAARPHAIGEMIRPSEAEGGYKVRFIGLGYDVEVLVPKPTQGQLILSTQCGQHGYWPEVITRAALLTGANRSNTLPHIMTALGGLEAKHMFLSELSLEQLNDMFLKASAENRAVCFMTTILGPKLRDRSVGSITFEPDKAYSVINFDPTTKTVTILDPSREIIPFDLSEDLSRGVARIPVEDLNRYFTRFFIEIGEPMPPMGKRGKLIDRFPQ
ncbi:MAG: hypothetical protein ACK5Y6_09855 [Pseudomonadota bacterium]